MVSVCLPSHALSQYLLSYLDFSYLERGVSLHGCSSKVQPLLLTLDKGYLLTAAVPDLQCGIAPLGTPVPAQPPLLRLLLPATGPGLGLGVLLRVTAQGRGATLLPRSHGCAGVGGPRGATPCSRSGGVVVRRYPSSKVRSSGSALLEQP